MTKLTEWGQNPRCPAIVRLPGRGDKPGDELRSGYIERPWGWSLYLNDRKIAAGRTRERTAFRDFSDARANVRKISWRCDDRNAQSQMAQQTVPGERGGFFVARQISYRKPPGITANVRINRNTESKSSQRKAAAQRDHTRPPESAEAPALPVRIIR